MPWVLRFEESGVPFGHGDLHGRVKVDLALLACGLDEGRRDRLGGRRLGQDARRNGKSRSAGANTLQCSSAREQASPKAL